jgi:hypothetical protein
MASVEAGGVALTAGTRSLAWQFGHSNRAPVSSGLLRESFLPQAGQTHLRADMGKLRAGGRRKMEPATVRRARYLRSVRIRGSGQTNEAAVAFFAKAASIRVPRQIAGKGDTGRGKNPDRGGRGQELFCSPSDEAVTMGHSGGTVCGGREGPMSEGARLPAGSPSSRPASARRRKPCGSAIFTSWWPGLGTSCVACPGGQPTRKTWP